MKFKELLSLVKVVSRNKIKQIDALGGGAVEQSKVGQLYHDLQDDKYKSEEEASFAFFGRSRYRMHYFNRLKRKLREKMVDSLFLIDLSRPDFSDYQHAYYSCYRYAVAVQILIAGYSRRAAIPLAKLALRKAIKYEFTDIVLQMAKILRFHYGAMEGELKGFHQFDQLILDKQAIYQTELELEGKYTELVMYFNAPKPDRVDFYAQARAYAAIAEERLQAYDSYKVGLYGFSIVTVQHQIIYDHEQLLRNCDRAVGYFKKKLSRSSAVALFTFSFKKIPSLIVLQEFDEAERVIDYCLSLIKKGRANYFKVLEYAILLYFHAQQYEKALQTLKKAYATEGFEGQTKQSTESWRIYDAYLHLFYEVGLVTARPSTKKRFRLNRLLNEVPKYSKDKRGANVTILTIQVLFLLQQGKNAEIIDRMEALKTYTHRYLRKGEDFRSNCFLKMLHKIPACSFNKKAVLRRSAPFRKRMGEMAFSETQQNLEAEIVPYEHLWKIAINLLP